MYICNVGSINVPDDIDKIFSSDGKLLISPTLGKEHFFEMSGEAMYYAIKHVENTSGGNLYAYKKRIVDAIVLRINSCGGIIVHNSLSGKENDTQLRATSAAIRAMIVSMIDGFEVKDYVSQLANYHFKFYLQWMEGKWFCHDTSEYNEKGPVTHLRTNVLNTSKENTLTLNTHFDSLSTLMLLEQYEEILNLSFSVNTLLVEALTSLKQLLRIDQNHSKINDKLQALDCKILQRNINTQDRFSLLYERLIHPLIFKVFSPTIFFKYGFIARDMAVLNRHLDYHVVNMVDISRFLCMLKKTSIINENQELFESFKLLLTKAVNIVESVPEYKNKVIDNDLSIAWLCELSLLLKELGITDPYQTQGYDSPQYTPFI